MRLPIADRVKHLLMEEQVETEPVGLMGSVQDGADRAFAMRAGALFGAGHAGWCAGRSGRGYRGRRDRLSC